MNKPKIAVAGATGFVGRWLIQELKADYQIIGLSRSRMIQQDPSIEWRQIDLFSVTSTQEALKDCDYAIYLVHSMQPNARLTQGSFEDNDLIIADNFSMSCEANNIKHVVYLSGIIPSVEKLSEHLESRKEVEEVLSSRNTPVTTLRAGMVVGPDGSSFKIMENLLKRLPFLILPAWTKTPSQAVSLEKVISSIKAVIGKEHWFNQSIDLGSGETLTYREMLKRCGAFLKLSRIFLSVPIRSTSFSKLWVSIVSGTSIELTSPLIDSLTYPIIPQLDGMKELGTYKAQPFEELLSEALHSKKQIKLKSIKEPFVKENNVRSIQRLPALKNLSSNLIAKEYMLWLPQFFKYFIRVKVKDEIAEFKFLFITLLELSHVNERSTDDRDLFFITGGLLCKRRDHGWLEFRQVNDKKWTITAIHEFVPTLPWWIYRFTQAPVHAWVMTKFGKYLDRKFNSGNVA